MKTLLGALLLVASTGIAMGQTMTVTGYAPVAPPMDHPVTP
jgi:hypothetical protein